MGFTLSTLERKTPRLSSTLRYRIRDRCPQGKDHTDVLRDELLKQLFALHQDADIVLQIGDVHIDIVGLAYRGGAGNTTLMPHLPDLRDGLIEWGLPVQLADQMVDKATSSTWSG